MKSMTVSAKAETVQRDWYLVDASGKTLGRLAAELARGVRALVSGLCGLELGPGPQLILICVPENRVRERGVGGPRHRWRDEACCVVCCHLLAL